MRWCRLGPHPCSVAYCSHDCRVRPATGSSSISGHHPAGGLFAWHDLLRAEPWLMPLGSARRRASGDRGPLETASDEDTAWTDAAGKEWPDDGRDGLPFEVYDAAPPPRKIGVAKLPPLTTSGDTLWHGAKHYKVLRVSNHYKYEGGRFVMRRKSIQAKELKRMARENMVSRLVYGKGGTKAGPRPPPSQSGDQ